MAVALMPQQPPFAQPQWHPVLKHAPPTPPMSATLPSRRPTLHYPPPGPSRVALPPIAHLDRSLSSMQPLTPPDDGEVAATGTRLPPILPGYHHQSPAMMSVDDPFVSSTPSKHSLYEIPAPSPSAPVEFESDRSFGQQPHRHATYSHYEPEQQQQPVAVAVVAPVYEHPPPPPQAVCVWDSAPHLIDWLDFTRTRSAHFIAEKTCEMICYLWFAERPVTRRPTPSAGKNLDGGSPGGNGAEHGGVMSGRDASMSYPSPHHSPSSPSRVTGTAPSELSTLLSVPSSGHLSAKTLNTTSSPTRSSPSTLQLVATPSFISFMQKLLETTQVSQSVIVLSLHYIYRLKERNHFTRAQRGSEFRIAVAGLMMANKFLDDNTYTNKTWSEVSGIELEEINRMEREFLLGVEFNLYVDKPTYESWLNLLKGLVQAKEKDSMSAGRNGIHGSGSREASTSRRRDARKVAARYHHHAQPPRPATAKQQQQQQQYQPANNYTTTPTRLPPLSRAVPVAAYYYPHTTTTSSNSSSSNSNAASSSQYTATTAVPPATATSSYYPRARSISPTPISYASDVRMDDALPLSATCTTTHSHSSHTNNNSNSASALPPSQYCHNHKRTAEAAFSPPSASFGAHLPHKRPSSMVLTIPDTAAFGSGMNGVNGTINSTGASASSAGGMSSSNAGGTSSAGTGYESSPMESLSDFSRMSLVEGSPEKRQRQEQGHHYASVQQAPAQPQSQPHQSQHQQPQHSHQPHQHQPHQHSHQPQQQAMVPTTLVAPYSYRVDARSQASKPQELYFYTLASSPMEPPVPPRSRNGRRRGVSNASCASVGEQDSSMDEVPGGDDNDDESVVEMEREEWEREWHEQEQGRDAHGERRRTRKARLMRTQTSTSTSASSGAMQSGQNGAYAYDYSRSVNAYRQQMPLSQYTSTGGLYHHHHVPAHPHPHASSAAPATTQSSTTMGTGGVHHAVQQRHHAQYVPTVVQSAGTSPASGVVYVRGSGEVGYAHGPAAGYVQQAVPPAQTYTTTGTKSAYQQQQQQKTVGAYDYSPSPQQVQEAPQPQAQHQHQQPHYAAQYPHHPHHHHHPTFERRVSRTSSHSWYSSQNQGGSVSYHPSPVQEKAEYFVPVPVAAHPPSHPVSDHRLRGYDLATQHQHPHPHQSQQQQQQQAHPSHQGQVYNGHGNGHVVALPHFHDNVWAKPPAVVLARREDDQERDERGRTLVPSSASSSNAHRLQAEVVSVSRSCSSGTGRSVSTHTTTSTTSGSTSAMTGTDEERRSEYEGDGYSDGDVEGGADGGSVFDGERDGRDGGEIPSAPFANAGPAGVYVPFGSEYARYQGYQQQQQYQQQYPPSYQHHQQYQHQSQQGAYTSGGVYAPAYGGYQVKGQARY